MTGTENGMSKETERMADTAAKPDTEAAKPETEAGGAAPADEDAAPTDEEGTATAEGGAPEEETPATEGDVEKPSAEAEIADLKDKLLRAVAETENLRRRASREKEDAAKYAISNFARDILAVADNLRRALESVPTDRGDGAANDSEVLASLIAGIEVTERELLAVMERHGIRRLDPLGDKFDHNYHQAMFEVETTDQPQGTVVQVLQTGYVIADRLLRPAMVGVAKGKRPASDGGDSDSQTGNGPDSPPGTQAGTGEKIDTVA